METFTAIDEPVHFSAAPPTFARQYQCRSRLKGWLTVFLIMIAAAAIFWAFGAIAWADSALPGTDASDKLEAAGTLLRLLDTALFKWGARIFAGLCVMSAAWSLKEQRFGIAIICLVGALIFGTATTWVKNIFAIGSGDSIFSN